MSMNEEYDLIICGGGLAGLTLARQLTLSDLGLSILVLEKARRPLPEAAFKVGESTIETGAYYYGKVLQLEDYLETEHLEKLGLRYFSKGPDGNANIATRPEYGVERFLPAKSYQLDRGKMENHLRDLVEAAGVNLKEGVEVTGIDLAQDGGPHVVTYEEGGEKRSATARWVVDALGRRRLIQKKLGLRKESPGMFNSAWFRVRGKLRVGDLVPASETEWHGRVKEDRWNSTNHLMNNGYWVWLIPLAPDNTSVGIVASEELHPFSGYSTYEKALAWLDEHEPLVGTAARDYPLLDFLKLKHYSYTSHKAFSADRWTCVGEAAAFADPYYSVGSNMIGFANGFTQRMIELDREGRLTPEYVEYANRFFLTLNDALTDTIHRGYPYLGNAPVHACKTIWDYYIGWTTTDPQFYHQIYLDPKLATIVSGLISPIVVTQGRMMRLLEDWGRHESSYTFGFIDYIKDLPTLCDLHVRMLPPKSDDFRRFMNTLREAVERIEELAHVIFFMAVRDVLPEKADLFRERPWINTGAISLDPSRWEKDGLFEPKTKPRDLSHLSDEIGRLFTVKNVLAGAAR
ncbi:MAG: NAD(P)/FAD-dependent oxidoreductase [Pyrinomonadaceae bacterium]